MYSPNILKRGVVVLAMLISSIVYSNGTEAIQLYNPLLSDVPSQDVFNLSKSWVELGSNESDKSNEAWKQASILEDSDQPAFHNKEMIDGVEWMNIIKPNQPLIHSDNYSFKSTLVKPSLLARNKEKILLLCAHGTFSNNKAFAGDSGYKNTQALVDFAKQLADKEQTAVELVSCTWSGKLNEHARKEAGDVIAYYVKQGLDSQDVSVKQIMTYAHSHGCNVISHAAKQLRNDCQRDIDVAIQVASPASDVSFTKENLPFKKMYHFYGSSDVTQAIGSFASRFHWGRKIHSNDERVHNIRLMKGNNELNHVDVKYHVASNLYNMITGIDEKFPHYRDLEISLQDGKPLLIGIRHKNVKNPQNFAQEISAHGYNVRNRSTFKSEFGHDMSERFKGKHKTFFQKVYNRVTSFIQEVRSTRDPRIK